MKRILILFVCIVFPLYLQAQTDTQWENYLPKTKVDSIVVFSTDTLQFRKGYVAPPNRKKLRKKAYKKALEAHLAYANFIKTSTEMLQYGRLDLNNYQDYANYYEKQYSISDSNEVKEFTSLFYERNDCEIVEQLACIPFFREIVIFFYESKPVFGMKICFSCYKIATTEPRDLQCFKSSDSFTRLVQEWKNRGWLDERLKATRKEQVLQGLRVPNTN